MKKLVIFDMDGVILDSEKLYMDENLKWFGEIGIKISIEDYQKFIGASANGFWTYLKENNNLTGEIAEYISLEKELKNKVLNEAELIATEGITDFLKHLRKNKITIAIASSGLRKNIDLILDKLALRQYFDLIVSGEQVTKGKPAPDIFLKVADHFQQEPLSCVVIEDSKNGITAAKSAGMFCIGFYNPNSGNQELSRADFVIDSFFDERIYQLT